MFGPSPGDASGQGLAQLAAASLLSSAPTAATPVSVFATLLEVSPDNKVFDLFAERKAVTVDGSNGQV